MYYNVKLIFHVYNYEKFHVIVLFIILIVRSDTREPIGQTQQVHIIHSFIHSGGLYSASSRHCYSATLQVQSRPKKDLIRWFFHFSDQAAAAGCRSFAHFSKGQESVLTTPFSDASRYPQTLSFLHCFLHSSCQALCTLVSMQSTQSWSLSFL